MARPIAHPIARPIALGIDVGTSGIRAIGIDTAGAVCLSRRVDLPGTQRSTRADGTIAEQTPDDWWRGLDDLLCAAGRDGQLADVRCVAFASTSGTLLAGDGDGKPLSPALMYDDGRGQSGTAAEQVRRWQPPAHLNTSALQRWLWLRDHLAKRCPDALPWLQADWLLHRLTGRRVGDENNALKFGYDPVAHDWPEALVEQLPPGILPPVVSPGTAIGPIRRELLSRWGLPEDAQACAGTTDSVAAVWASDARETGDAVTSLGSTLALKLVSDRPVFDNASGVYSHCFAGRYLISGASNSGGQALRQCFSDEELAGLSDRIDPEFDPKIELGLDYWPLPGPGERFPINDPAFPPRMTPQPADRALFLSALLHGIARIERAGYARFAQLGTPAPTRVFSSGGGAKNPAWRRIRARILGLPILDGGSPEPALGAARLALNAWPQQTATNTETNISRGTPTP